MPTLAQLKEWAAVAQKKNYYELLRVPIGATPVQIKAAFHTFALRFHPDAVAVDGPEAVTEAAEIFKRGAEAYNILGKPQLRSRYDDELRKGRLRMDERKLPSAPPPPPLGRTLEQIATTPAAKKHAARGDRLLSIGKLSDARVALTSALQQEPDNVELQERLDILYEALALEPD